MAKSQLTVEQILAWADAHHAHHGSWPTERSGSGPAAPGESWKAVDSAMRQGLRGLPGGDSLARLLARERGVLRRGWHSERGRWYSGR
jgi:hypothetical protein